MCAAAVVADSKRMCLKRIDPMKTKRKKLITVMIGIILLISQQIIAGTNYVKTVNSTGGTISATEFISGLSGATIPQTNN